MKSARKPGLPALLALLVVLATLVACGGNGGGDTPGDRPTPTGAGETSGVGSPAATPVEETQDGSRMSLEEYLAAVCGGEAELADWEEDASLREVSSGLGDVIQVMESLEPPSEVAGWHDAGLAFQRAFKKTVDDYLANPGGQSEDEFLFSMFFTLASYFEPVEQAIAAMDPATRSVMVAAGCIDEETATTTSTAIEAEEIAVGESLARSLEFEETDYFVFEAETGQEYLIEVAWDGSHVVFLRVQDPHNPQDYGEISGLSPLVRRWTAPESGAFYIEVRHQGVSTTAASYTVSVSIDAGPDSPSGVRAAWEGTAVTVSWDPVEGAEYYKVYYDRDGVCYDCDELAANVVGAAYTHASPALQIPNHYWVVACNQEGCSAIDAENPATPGARPAPSSPTNQRYAVLGNGSQARITWDAVDGADFYAVYHNNRPSCSVDSSGPSSCELIGPDEIRGATMYFHTRPDPVENYYWVVACTRAGCSAVDSDNPATPE